MAKIIKGQRIQIDSYVEQTKAKRVRDLSDSEFVHDWNSPTDQTKVYINPPNLKPSQFASLEDRNRILAFYDKDPSKSWVDWAKKHKIKISSFAEPSKTSLITELCSRTKLTKAAADLLARLKGIKPIQAYMWVITALNDIEPDKPINPNRLLELLEGTEDLKASEINRSLGTKESLVLIKQLKANRAIPLLYYLEISVKDKLTKEMLNLTRKLIEDKEMSPKVAMVWFVFCRYQWEQNKKEALLSLAGMDFLKLV